MLLLVFFRNCVGITSLGSNPGHPTKLLRADICVDEGLSVLGCCVIRFESSYSTQRTDYPLGGSSTGSDGPF